MQYLVIHNICNADTKFRLDTADLLTYTRETLYE